MFRSRWYPGVFQFAGLAVFSVVMLATLFGPTMVEDNVGSTIVWILWWPLLPLSYFALLALLVHGVPVPSGRRVVPAPHGRELESAALLAPLRHLDHRPHVPVHHLGRPRVRHRRVAARYRLPATGDARRRHRHEPLLRAPRLLQPPLLSRRAVGQLLDDRRRSPFAPTRKTAGRWAARISGAPTARSARPPALCTRCRAPWTPTATATCAATA